MASELHLDAIKHSGGTSALTIDSNGNVHKAGMTVQTVNANTSTEVSTSTTSFVATGLFLNITPKFSTSKILISFSAPMYVGTEASHAIATCYRETSTASANSAISGTNLGGTWGFGSVHVDTSDNSVNWVNSVINCAGIEDSPSTTSQLRYAVAIRTYASATNYFCVNTMTATMTAQEIAQ